MAHNDDPAKQTPTADTPLPAFRIMTADNVPLALVMASPHSGTFYPSDMGASAPQRSIRQVEDAAVDQLIVSGTEHGATIINANYGRAYVDLNRAADDLDPSMIIDALDKPPSPKSLAGYGVLHRICADATPLYQHRLTLAQAQQRLARVHHPYHQALSELMQRQHAEHGHAVLIDWHSMPARATGPEGPDIVLGDRYGSSCDSALSRLMRRLFETRGLTVGLNRPYAGGHATQIWGRPDEGFNALQVEINRRLYWNERNHVPGAGWKRCHSAIAGVIAELCAEMRAGKLSVR